MFKPSSAALAAEQKIHPLSNAEADELFSIFFKYNSLLFAVSGGSDSLALIHLADEWRKRQGREIKFLVAHVDHGLRSASVQDASHVEEFCQARELPFIALQWQGEKPVTSIQSTARAARYKLLTKAAKEHRCEAMVTGHTLDDQAETILMRLARGSGLQGLEGMAKLSKKEGCDLLRPLLDIPKTRLRATLHEAQIPWREDESNTDGGFLRPRLRRLLPLLAEEGLGAARFKQFARKVARANAALDFAASAILENMNDSKLERKTYCAAPTEIRLRILKRIIASFSCSSYPPSDEALENLDAAINNHEKARRTLGGVIFSAGPRYLRFMAEKDARQIRQKNS